MAAVLFGVFGCLVVLRVPIALSLAMAAAVAVGTTHIPLTVVAQRFFASCDVFPMMAVPFFMIAGGLMAGGGVSKRLVAFANSIVGTLPGGLAVVVIVASVFFGALSGSSTATVAAIGTILIPSMIKAGYGVHFSLATVASAGFLGIIIPPSIPMVNYGVSTGTSIGKMFLAGFVPGLLLAFAMCVVAVLYGKKHVPIITKFSLAEVWRTFKEAIWALLMPVIILGGIYGGIFTATESACVASFYGLFVGMFIYKELDVKGVYKVMVDAVVSSAMIMFIVAAAGSFGFVMTRELIPVAIANAILSVSENPIIFLMLVNVLLLVVGTFMETNAAILIMAPMFITVLGKLGIDPVHFGIVMIVNLAIGMITPPLGVNLFVAAGIQKVNVDTVVNRHLIHYILVCLAVLLLLTFIPQITLILPDIVMPNVK